MNNLFFLAGAILLMVIIPLLLVGLYKTSDKNESISKNIDQDIDSLGQNFDEKINTLKQDIEDFEL